MCCTHGGHVFLLGIGLPGMGALAQRFVEGGPSRLQEKFRFGSGGDQPSTSIQAAHQRRHGHIQRISQAGDVVQANVPLTPLDRTHVVGM